MESSATTPAYKTTATGNRFTYGRQWGGKRPRKSPTTAGLWQRKSVASCADLPHGPGCFDTPTQPERRPDNRRQTSLQSSKHAQSPPAANRESFVQVLPDRRTRIGFVLPLCIRVSPSTRFARGAQSRRRSSLDRDIGTGGLVLTVESEGGWMLEDFGDLRVTDQVAVGNELHQDGVEITSPNSRSAFRKAPRKPSRKSLRFLIRVD